MMGPLTLFQPIDIGPALPLVILAAIAIAILLTLIARSVIRSKIAGLIAVAAIVIFGGSAIGGWLQSIALLVGVGGLVVIGVVWSLGRNPDVAAIVAAYRPSQPAGEDWAGPALGTRPDRPSRLKSPALPQLPAGVKPDQVQLIDPVDLKDWGF